MVEVILFLPTYGPHVDPKLCFWGDPAPSCMCAQGPPSLYTDLGPPPTSPTLSGRLGCQIPPRPP